MVTLFIGIIFWMFMVGVTIVAGTEADRQPDGDEFYVYILFWPILLPVAFYEIYKKRKHKE